MGIHEQKRSQETTILALWGMVSLFWHGATAFTTVPAAARHRPLPPRDGQQSSRLSLRAATPTFATDQYLNQLSQIQDYYYSTAPDPQTYMETLSAFTSSETASTLMTSASEDDMWRRISMAADYPLETSATTKMTLDAAAGATAAAATGNTGGPVVDSWMMQQAAPDMTTNDALTTAPSSLLTNVAADAASTAAAADTASTATTSSAAAATSSTATEPPMDALRSQLSELATAYNFKEPAAIVTGDEADASPLAGVTQALGDFGQNSQQAWQHGREAWSTLSTNTGRIWSQATTDTPGSLPGPVLDSTRALQRGTSAVLHSPVYLVEETKNTVKLVTADLSISQLAERMGQTLAFLGKTFVLVLNVIIEAITGDTLADVVQGAQTTVQDLTQGAIASVVQTAHQIGDMTVTEALTSMAKLIALVTTVLFRILSGVLELATGKNAGEWGTLAAQTVQREAHEVVVAASATATDLSHKSLSELVAVLGHFEEQAASAVMSTATLALDSIDSTTMAVANTLASQ